MHAAPALRAFVDELHQALVHGLRARLSSQIRVLSPPASEGLKGPTLVVVLQGVRPGPAGLILRFELWTGAATALEEEALRAAVGVALGRDPLIAHGEARLRAALIHQGEDLLVELTPA